MKKKYELVVKGINNYPDKITVTVALEIGGYPSLLLPDVAISLDRTEGATLEFYEAEAKKAGEAVFSWMLLPGYVKGMVRCRKSGPSF